MVDQVGRDTATVLVEKLRLSLGDAAQQIDALVEFLETQAADEAPQGLILDAILEYVDLSVPDALGPVRRLFSEATVEAVFVSVALFLQTTIHARERVVVIDPSMHVAIDLLVNKIDGPECWGQILELDLGIIVGFLESTVALPQNHSLHYTNLIPVIIRRALDCSSLKRGAILDRLCSRGYAAYVVSAIVDLHKATPTASLPGILECFPEAAQGTRPFVTELLSQVSELEPSECRATAMETFLPMRVYNASLQARLQLDVLLTRGRLGYRSVNLLVEYLDRISARGGEGVSSDALMTAVERVSGIWGGPYATNKLSPYHQKVLATFLVRSFRETTLSKANLESRAGLLPTILKGISLYLENPMENVRKIGMCVGNALSGVLSPDGPPIFPVKGLDDAIQLNLDSDTYASPHEGHLDRKKLTDVSFRTKMVVVGKRDDREPDSDDETDSEFGYQSDLSNLDQDDAEQNFRLQQVVKMLGGTEDNWKEQLEAISVSEEIIRASPDELALYVGPLVKGLMFTRLPTWAQVEGDKEYSKNDDSKSSYEQRRMDSLLALVEELPEAAGECLIDAFYSASSNIEHRTKSLQLLSSGAKGLPSDVKGQIILGWSAKLLIECDKPRHGVDMFGKDTYLLGCFLCTMGNFLESCGGTMDALYIGTAVLKLVLSDRVRCSPETFVRRSALAAAARAISSVPPSSICASVAEDMIPNVSVQRGRGTPTSREFSSLLISAKSWFEDVLKDTEGDDTCQKLARGCSNYLQLLVIDALEEHTRQLEVENAEKGLGGCPADVCINPLLQPLSTEIRVPPLEVDVIPTGSVFKARKSTLL